MSAILQAADLHVCLPPFLCVLAFVVYVDGLFLAAVMYKARTTTPLPLLPSAEDLCAMTAPRHT